MVGNSSNIVIAILDFFLLHPIQLSLFQLCDSKSYCSYSFCFNICISFVNGSGLLFCIASHIVIALPTIAIVGRAITLEREPSKKKQGIHPLKLYTYNILWRNVYRALFTINWIDVPPLFLTFICCIKTDHATASGF